MCFPEQDFISTKYEVRSTECYHKDIPLEAGFFMGAEVLQQQVCEFTFLAETKPIGVMVFDNEESEKSNHAERTLAYDTKHDERRFQELLRHYSDVEARTFLLEEMTQDLVTHFAELGGEHGRILSFSWKYLISNGTLVEDTQLKKPIREMFEKTSDTASKLWRDYLIPGLEEMPIGSSVFTLSSRDDGAEFEGVYDFIYLFHKIDSSAVLAFGLGLDLSKEDRIRLINGQVMQTDNYWLMLTDSASFKDMRGRAVFYPPGWFEDPMCAYRKILETITSDKRTLISDPVAIFQEAQQLMEQKNCWIETLALQMVDEIIKGNTVNQILQKHQIEEMWKYQPQLMYKLQDERVSGIMLPCGWVDLGFDLLPTVGDGLVGLQINTVECVQKKCRRCNNTDIAESDTKCRKCGWAPGDVV